MMDKDFFNEMVKFQLFDGRIINMPFLFVIFNFDKDGLKSQELAEIINGQCHFICM